MTSKKESRISKRTSLLGDYCDRLGHAVLRHRAHVALHAAKVSAETTSRTKTEFIAKMSHELRTPLNAIIGFSEVLGTSSTPIGADTQSEYVKYIEDSARHLLAVVNNILELSKIQCGRVTLHKEPVDFEELLKSCIVLFQDSIAQHSLELFCNVRPDLPMVHADITKLRQILINLISNAVKFTPAGGRITITVDMHQNDAVRMVVRDTGIGMTPDQLEVALQPFGQADNGHNRQYEGSGLGLPIVRALTEFHNGRFVIHSERGKGTIATLTLPVHDNRTAQRRASLAARRADPLAVAS
jgi:two-component system cell cycle sensor histidine kinase PleC